MKKLFIDLDRTDGPGPMYFELDLDAVDMAAVTHAAELCRKYKFRAVVLPIYGWFEIYDTAHLTVDDFIQGSLYVTTTRVWFSAELEGSPNFVASHSMSIENLRTLKAGQLPTTMFMDIDGVIYYSASDVRWFAAEISG